MDFLKDEKLSDSEKVKMYLQNKGRAEAEAANAERQSGMGWAQFAAGVGDTIAGRDPSKSAALFDGYRKNIKDETLGEYDKKRKTAIEDYDISRKVNTNAAKDDVNSQESIMARSLAVDMGMDKNLAGKMTATQFENLSPYLKAKYEAKIREMDRRDLRAQRQEMYDEKRADKAAEKAKLSEKHVEAFTDLDNAKSDLDNIVGMLGDNKHWAGKLDGAVPDLLVGSDQVAWRSAVGKYKDAYRKAITGAGASATEIAMLEKRLPSEYDAPEDFKAKANEALAEIARRKGTLASNLKKIGKNVEGFESAPMQEAPPPQVVKIKAPNGAIKIIPADQAQAAIKAGGTLVDNVAGR